jgi:hypothetical protein
MMDTFREKKDIHGKYWFAIPVHDSSREDEVVKLENRLSEIGLKNRITIQKSCCGYWIIPVEMITDWGLIMFQPGQEFIILQAGKTIE